MHVRLATVDDAERINDVRIAGWQAAYAGVVPADYLAGLDARADDERRRGFLRDPLPGVRNWVSEQVGQVVGWCATGPTREDDLEPSVHELWALYVDPQRWRGGHGAALLRHARRDARERGFSALVLWVLDANPLGRAFYEREGFRAVAGEKALSVGGRELAEVRYRLELEGI
jgi:ribosomal protein S18 acetylase RimI-like enzyme